MSAESGNIEPKNGEKGTLSADDVRLREIGALPEDELTGIALSGGGIRSASFAIGVIQGLLLHLNKECLKKIGDHFDYLSTVSGGGYFGATITWLTHNQLALDEQLDSVAGGFRNRDERNWLDYVRQHGSYLQPSSVSILSLISVVLRNIVVSLTIYLGLAVMLFAFVKDAGYLPQLTLEKPLPIWTIPGAFLLAVFLYVLSVFAYPVATFIGSFQPRSKIPWFPFGMQPILGVLWVIILAWVGWQAFGELPLFGMNRILSFETDPGFFIALAYLLVFAASVYALIRVLLTEDKEEQIPSSNYRGRLYLQQHAGKLLGFLILTGTVSIVPIVHQYISRYAIEASSLTSTLGVLGAIYQFAIGRESSMSSSAFAKLRILITSGLLIFGLLLGAYTIANDYEGFIRSNMSILFVTIIALGFLVNTNYFGISRMYRDRLMETFTPDKDTVRSGQWSRAIEADTCPISEMSKVRPYPLINTNVVLTDSEEDYFKGRGGDNFVIAPKYSGSDATGYLLTKHWLRNKMNLPTAVAISGAAINPNTGVGDSGITRNRLVSFLLSLLQLRIGYWAPNVKHTYEWPISFIMIIQKYVSTALRPNYWIPGLMQGLLGRGLTASSSLIELTDGGHFDNTGAYELIRRELNLIIMTLASADRNYLRTDLANLIRKVRVDFGAVVTFGTMDFKKTIPGGSDNRADRGYMIGSIVYSNGKTGTLVAIIATPIETLGPELVSYLRSHPSFPNEPTSDQFYSEEQFEAYRELGLLITRDFTANGGIL